MHQWFAKVWILSIRVSLCSGHWSWNICGAIKYHVSSNIFKSVLMIDLHKYTRIHSVFFSTTQGSLLWQDFFLTDFYRLCCKFIMYVLRSKAPKDLAPRRFFVEPLVTPQSNLVAVEAMPSASSRSWNVSRPLAWRTSLGQSYRWWHLWWGARSMGKDRDARP